MTVSYTVKHSYTISLDIYLSEMKICIRPKTTMQMVTVALFVVTKPGNRSDVVLLVRNKQTVVPVEHQAGDGGYAHDMAICWRRKPDSRSTQRTTPRVRHSGKGNARGTGNRSVLFRAGGGGRNWLHGGVEFGVTDLFCLVRCNGDMTLCICQNLQDWTVKRMDFTVCKLYLNKSQKVL